MLAADAAYAMPLATTLRSLCESNGHAWPLEIHILHDGIDTMLRQRITASLPAGSASIAWHGVDLASFTTGYAVLPHISKMTYARLLLSSLLAVRSDRVLYLDSDILVIGPLDRLWHLDLGGAVVGAVPDPLGEDIKLNMPGLEDAPRVACYFNAGVLLIDLGKWREMHISEKAIAYLDKVPQSPFSDQDALNFACDGHWTDVGPEWNFQCKHWRSVSSANAAEQPAIVHFVTGMKPWKPGSLSVNASLYDSYRARTLFARGHRQKARDAVMRMGHRLLKKSVLVRALWRKTKLAIGPACAPAVRTTITTITTEQSD